MSSPRLVRILAVIVVLMVAAPAARSAVAAQQTVGTQSPAAAKGPKAMFQLTDFGPRDDDNAALKWSEQTLKVIRMTKLPPTAVSRALAIIQTSVYDAWAAYDPVADPVYDAGWQRRPADERNLSNKGMAVSYAAYRSLLDLFPAQEQVITDLMVVGLKLDAGYVSTDVSDQSPAAVGNRAAQAVLDARRNDGSNQLGDLHIGAYSDYTDYIPVNSPETVVDKWRWQPLRLTPNGPAQKFATPQWGRVKPFALTGPEQFPLPGPNLRKDYKKGLKEVVKFSAKLDDTDKAIAEYWSDGPSSELPPGHAAIFAGALCRQRGNNLDNDVKLLFLQANAVLDAGIAVWYAKVKYDFVRPITLVHVLMMDEKIKAWGGPGKGTVDMLGQDWQPYQRTDFVTPPFAEYVSGHSAFTAATFQVLRSFTGTNKLNLSVTIDAGSSQIEPGITPAKAVTLSWKTMDDAADQAGTSREYGGIHFHEGDMDGRALGVKIGNVVYAKAQAYFNGTAR
jgi:uncharacterized protein DUF6851/vanadium-dependent haloperoxidase-like protein